MPDHRRSGPPEVFTVNIEENSVLTLDRLEKQYIQSVLRFTYNNKAYAAVLLGLDRRTLYRKLAAYQLEA